jgi:methylated-DNA-protein-cysteine methyltransferase-like protein
VSYLLGTSTQILVLTFSRLTSDRGHPSGAANQAQVLRGEGVSVNTGNLGELMIDLAQYGWFPRQLPSDTAAGLAPFDDSES